VKDSKSELFPHVPKDIQMRYKCFNYRHAAAILANDFPAEAAEVWTTLRLFRITNENMVKKGGNESEIPKEISKLLRPRGWMEKKLRADLTVDQVIVQSDTHKIDYVKGRIALDVEWNSKDQTFDRDLYAFRAFWDYGKISVAVLITRSTSLNPIFKRLKIMAKYGASTTHTDKLLPRLRAGRSGGCPVLVFGITPASITTLEAEREILVRVINERAKELKLLR